MAPVSSRMMRVNSVASTMCHFFWFKSKWLLIHPLIIQQWKSRIMCANVPSCFNIEMCYCLNGTRWIECRKCWRDTTTETTQVS
jgi:hypothetical protein